MPASFCFFQSFQSNIDDNVKNVHRVSPARNSNSQPSDHVSPPLTTRPGLKFTEDTNP